MLVVVAHHDSGCRGSQPKGSAFRWYPTRIRSLGSFRRWELVADAESSTGRQVESKTAERSTVFHYERRDGQKGWYADAIAGAASRIGRSVVGEIQYDGRCGRNDRRSIRPVDCPWRCCSETRRFRTSWSWRNLSDHRRKWKYWERSWIGESAGEGNVRSPHGL